jgi:1-acyl-sn-glycerol-3-phosphate acyltransferase
VASGIDRVSIKAKLARRLLRLLGWGFDGVEPTVRRCVLIAAPHTSNWDFPLMLLYAASFSLRIHWLAKHSLFVFPLGYLMRFLGGIPVYRNGSHNLVQSMTERFSSVDSFVLVIPTEGSRGYTEYWKSGFYHIACSANVPILPSFLDYQRRLGGFAAPLTPSGEIVSDMNYLREIYAPMQGLRPGQFGPVRLREESEPNLD